VAQPSEALTLSAEQSTMLGNVLGPRSLTVGRVWIRVEVLMLELGVLGRLVWLEGRSWLNNVEFVFALEVRPSTVLDVAGLDA
jgi:hypothetical protein